MQILECGPYSSWTFKKKMLGLQEDGTYQFETKDIVMIPQKNQTFSSLDDFKYYLQIEEKMNRREIHEPKYSNKNAPIKAFSRCGDYEVIIVFTEFATKEDGFCKIYDYMWFYNFDEDIKAEDIEVRED